MADITAWALRKADEIVRQHGPRGAEDAEALARLRDAITEALFEAYGLGQEPTGDD